MSSRWNRPCLQVKEPLPGQGLHNNEPPIPKTLLCRRYVTKHQVMLADKLDIYDMIFTGRSSVTEGKVFRDLIHHAGFLTPDLTPMSFCTNYTTNKSVNIVTVLGC